LQHDTFPFQPCLLEVQEYPSEFVMFYGERIARLLDSFGHDWMIGSQHRRRDA
jgi:hypothetical protein